LTNLYRLCRYFWTVGIKSGWDTDFEMFFVGEFVQIVHKVVVLLIHSHNFHDGMGVEVKIPYLNLNFGKFRLIGTIEQYLVFLE
jgi:hypothetical protein